MTSLSAEVIRRLAGKTLATAESLTGGGIGSALTAVPGSSAVYKGGIISYTNAIKERLLGVPEETLERYGAVSAPVALAMAQGAMKRLGADAAVSATGLAGPTADAFGNPVGTVFLGYADGTCQETVECHFAGDRDSVRRQSVEAALKLVLRHL